MSKKGKKLSDSWSTPQDLFNELNSRFGPFDLDVCANDGNAKCSTYIRPEDDALQQNWWVVGSNAWMNPPYSDPYPWIQKASEEAKKGIKVVCLLKADHTPKWYKDFIYDYSKEAFYPGVKRVDLPKRIRFVPPPGLLGKDGKPVKRGSPNYPSMVIIFNGSI